MSWIPSVWKGSTSPQVQPHFPGCLASDSFPSCHASLTSAPSSSTVLPLSSCLLRHLSHMSCPSTPAPMPSPGASCSRPSLHTSSLSPDSAYLGPPGFAITIDNGTFTWAQDLPPSLHRYSFSPLLHSARIEAQKSGSSFLTNTHTPAHALTHTLHTVPSTMHPCKYS